MRAGRTLRLVVVAALAAIALPAAAQAAGSSLPALAPAPRDALTLRLANGRLSEAEYALERARSLFRLASVRARFGMVARPGPRDATLVLRDLAARLHRLPPALRAEAERVLARPTDTSGFGPRYAVSEAEPYCTANTCVHYVATTADAPPATDANADGIPDYVESVGAELEHIWSVQVAEYGFRAPKQDLSSKNHGPDGRIDVYIADVGSDRLYGYCTSDDPNLGPSYPYGDVSAYCVLDNDYTPSQFPGSATGLELLQVTAAHEFFHAVQGAYDFFDDGVLMEGTAVWVEDELYDDVDDNYQYLKASALARPEVPFDLALSDFSQELAGFQYGAFVFFRFLGETQGGPELIRRIWERADASPGAPDDYSVQAVDAAMRERRSSFRAAFRAFGAANAFPEAAYEEGSAYPTPPFLRTATVRPSQRIAAGRATLDHLTHAYVSFRPGTGVKPAAKLRISVDLPARFRGAEATVVVSARDGTLTSRPLALDPDGDGARTVAFGRGRIASAVLVLTNAGARYDCWRGSPYACQGFPLDDNLVFRYSAALVQRR